MSRTDDDVAVVRLTPEQHALLTTMLADRIITWGEIKTLMKRYLLPSLGFIASVAIGTWLASWRGTSIKELWLASVCT
jgi:hypothetical protein